jgi:hypothetical protein
MINPEIRRRAFFYVAMAQHLGLPTPEITPTDNGTWYLEWETPLGDALLEIGRTRIAGYMKSPETTYFRDCNPEILTQIKETLWQPESM